MNGIPLLLAPLALLLPSFAQLPGEAVQDSGTAQVTPDARVSAIAPMGAPAPAFEILEEARDTQVQQQVRIEERVIIRIAPATPAARDRLMAQSESQAARSSVREEPLKGCVQIENIARVQPAPENRLLLFMRDRRVLSAALERSCNARDFYSGAYVERSEDGQLCSRRERLQSRSGANCQVAQLNRLVAVRD